MQIKAILQPALGFLEGAREINQNRYSWNHKNIKSRATAIALNFLLYDSMNALIFIIAHFKGAPSGRARAPFVRALLDCQSDFIRT